MLPITAAAITGPAVFLSRPPAQHLKFPPDPLPPTLPPPSEYGTLKSPFSIPGTFYTDSLSARVPLTIATIYITTALVLNQVNRHRGYKPYAFSKTKAFYYSVLLHNFFLAVFSAVSFIGISNALRATWPGLSGKHGLPGAIDSLCRLHGPRGYGDAVTFNASTQLWETKNRLIRLADNRLTPDDSDVGRIWNEGLAFWGWVFYLSKFYEVVDTAILLAKGKRSPTLQTYHHAGAMLCMWAGMRFMSPPIWMWVALNSAIHTIMYTYYTLSTLRIRVPAVLKQTLTTLQITQLTVGVLFASLHLFISYSVPVSVPYTLASIIEAAPSSVSPAAAVASSAIKSAMEKPALSSLAAAATSGNLAWLKKLAYRAAGAEGLAENVRNDEGKVFGAEHTTPMPDRLGELRYRTEYRVVDCIETSGQAFAVWLNVFYLLPLIVLFVRFFYKAYVAKTLGMPQKVVSSAKIASKKTSDAVEKAGRTAEKGMDSIEGRVHEGPEDLAYKRKLENEMVNANGWNGHYAKPNGPVKLNGHATPNGRAVAKSEGEWLGSKAKKAVNPKTNEEATKETNTDSNTQTRDQSNILGRRNS